MEEFKTIEEFPKYQIFRDGRLINITTGKFRKPQKDSRGYVVALFYKDKKYYSRWVHRLVAEAFIEKPNHMHNLVDHINGIRSDNRVENLRWVTPTINRDNTYKECPCCGYRLKF